MLLQKQQHIQRVVATIERVREIVKDNDTIDPGLLMLMIRSVQHEEEQRQWLSGRLPDTLVQSIFMSEASPEERNQVEREITIGLNDLLILSKQGLQPEHHLVQERALALMQIIEEWFGESLQGLGTSEIGSALEETNWQLYPGSFPPDFKNYLYEVFTNLNGRSGE
ncbi:hypothetical protein [Paenibacillus sp. NPDC058177]|uniref:hypothetical protein n=1 Tax=Paenibacillus sp. NPDC058177 TaxID=3346369 RepID=UPI0036D8D0C5